MSDVFIYDAALSPVSSSLVQIVENDSRGVKIDQQPNAAQPGGLYGASMKQPTPAVPVGFWVDDTSGAFAPTGLEYLNPSSSLRLDVTLFPLPVGASVGGGGGGHPPPRPGPDDDDDLTLRQDGGWQFQPRGEPAEPPVARPLNDIRILACALNWTEQEEKGVATLIATIAQARTLIAPDQDFKDRLRRWESRLRGLGVYGLQHRGGRGTGGAPSGGGSEPHLARPLPGMDFGNAGSDTKHPLKGVRKPGKPLPGLLKDLEYPGAHIILPEEEIG